MKLHYALDEAGQLIGADQLLASDRGGRFLCLGCGDPLRARLGRIKQWHFAHRPGSHCTRESYLHRLGKQVFFDCYRHCLLSGSPFVIGFYQQICQRPFAHLPGLESHCCSALQSQRYDLTRYYPHIVMEQREGDFVPDLALHDRHGVAGVFVEIRVSHGCTRAKLDSGQRIIEITLTREADVDLIRRGLREQRNLSLKGQDLSYEGPSPVRFYNFGRQARLPEARCACYEAGVFLFSVCRYSRRASQRLMTLPQADLWLRRAGHRCSYVRCVLSEGHTARSQRARQAWHAGLQGATAAGAPLLSPPYGQTQRQT